jgi:hypothetical protein
MTASFRSGIQTSGGLVENQDRSVADDRTGNGDALALPAGQCHAAFAEHGVIPFRHFVDELMRIGHFGCFL